MTITVTITMMTMMKITMTIKMTTMIRKGGFQRDSITFLSDVCETNQHYKC